MLIIAYFIIATYLTGINNFVEKYEKIAESNDIDEFADSLIIPDGAKGDTKNFKNLIENSVPQLSANIIKSAKLLEKDNRLASNEVYLDDIHIANIKKSKYLYFFTKYEVSLIASPLTISSEQEDLEVSINGEKFKVNDEKNIGNYIPGIYEYNAKTSGVEKKLKGSIQHPSQSGEPYDISYETFNLTATSSMENAEIYFNDEPQGTTFKNTWAVIQNVIEDESIKVTARFEENGETYISDQSYKLEIDSIMNFTFEDYEKQLEKQKQKEEQKIAQKEEQKTSVSKNKEVTKFFNDFISEYDEALNNANFNNVESYFEKGTSSLEGYKEHVLKHNEYGEYYYKFKSNEIEKLEQINETTYRLVHREKFIFDRPVDAKYDYDRVKEYTIIYDQDLGKYLIRNIEVLNTEVDKM